MSLMDTLKKHTKKVLTLSALALAVLASPVKAKGAEKTGDKPPAPAQEVVKDAQMRQKQLEAVVKTAMNAGVSLDVIAGEAAKYIDFPVYIPVTQDGKFNEQMSQQWIQAFDFEKNAPLLEQYQKDLKAGVPLDKAYGDLVKKIADGDQAKEQDLLKLLPAIEEVIGKARADNVANNFKQALGGAAVFGLFFGSIFTIGGLSQLEEKHVVDGALVFGFPILLTSVVGLLSDYTNMTSPLIKGDDFKQYTIEMHQDMYKDYVSQRVVETKDKIVVRDAQNAANDVTFYKIHQNQNNSR